jgi:hypothetical protein
MNSAQGELEALVQRAGRLAGRLARVGWRVTARMPGGELVQQQMQRIERAVLGEPADARSVDSRAVDRRAAVPERGADAETPTLVGPAAGQPTALRAAMAELLNRSIDHNREHSKEYLFTGIVSQLLPDEARILAALSDGTRFPVVHVLPRGGAAEPVLRNASTVGKAAGVAAFRFVPHYLTRLHGLGLVRIEAEDEDLAVQYDILLTEDVVQQAVEHARGRRRLAPHVERRTVVLSELGEQFWRACDPTGVATDSHVTEPKAGYDPADYR